MKKPTPKFNKPYFASAAQKLTGRAESLAAVMEFYAGNNKDDKVLSISCELGGIVEALAEVTEKLKTLGK